MAIPITTRTPCFRRYPGGRDNIKVDQHEGWNEYTINVDKYAGFNLALVWQDSSGNPINLTGYTANLTVQDEYSNTVVLTLSTSNSEIVLGGSAGTITLALTPTGASVFKCGIYKYDLLLTDGSGIKTRQLEGSFVVKALEALAGNVRARLTWRTASTLNSPVSQREPTMLFKQTNNNKGAVVNISEKGRVIQTNNNEGDVNNILEKGCVVQTTGSLVAFVRRCTRCLKLLWVRGILLLALAAGLAAYWVYVFWR